MDNIPQLHQPDSASSHAITPSDSLMNASPFVDFSLSYDGPPGLSPGAAASDRGTTASMDQPAASHQLLSQSSNMPLVDSDPAVDSSQRRNSPASSGNGDQGDQGDSPHAGNAMDDDTGGDDFGFSAQNKDRADGTDLGARPKDDKADAPPAWSELKTKAGKERKRLPLACIACRRKKIRCSGEKPACRHCLRSRIPCVYKVTARKAAPRTDYMAMLDKRLKRMEERIIKVVPKTEQDSNVASVTRAVVKPAMPGTLPSGKSTGKKRNAEDAFGPDLEAWARAPSKSTIADDHRKASLQTQEAEETQLFREGEDALPSKDVQEHLAEVFFDNIYGQAYHLLHKPSYMRRLRNNSLPPVLVLSVCAIAARFAVTPKLDTTTRTFLRGEEWASRAREICMKRYDGPNITILTCLLILGLHEFGTCQGGRSWALGGQAIRMAFALQLHKDLEYDPLGRNGKTQLSFVDREIRRRVMWACFLMDRFNSSGTDRPIFIKEETIKIPLPVKERNFQLDIPAPTETLDGRVLPQPLDEGAADGDARNNMGVAAYMIRSVALWGRMVTYLNQGGKDTDAHPIWSEASEFAKLARDAEQLLTTLPEALQYSQENLQVHRTESTASQFLLLHISIQQNLLFLYRSALPQSHRRSGQAAQDNFFTNAVQRTYAAANRMSDIIRDSEESQCYVMAPFAGYCAFSSTTIHILGIFSNDRHVKATAERNLGGNVKFLHRMMKYWGLFHWMVENIRSQYRAAADAAQSGTLTVEGNAASPVLQYGDWFDRYPHGVSNAEFMDPATTKDKEKGADAVLEQKPELQSVEEFFETITAQSSEAKDTPRAASKSKRGAASKKAAAVTSAPSSQKKPGPSDNSSILTPQVETHPAQNGNFSGLPTGQTSGPIEMHTLAVPQAPDQSFHSMSPISPAQMHHLAQNTAGQQGFFPPNALSMNLAQQSTGIMQPLDRQLVFGGYSMDPGGISGMQNLPELMGDWDGVSSNPQAGGALMRGMKGGLNGSYPQTPGQYMGGPMANLGTPQASSAWFMPFNVEPPDPSQDMGWAAPTADALGGMFGNGADVSQNPLGGLQRGP